MLVMLGIVGCKNRWISPFLCVKFFTVVKFDEFLLKKIKLKKESPKIRKKESSQHKKITRYLYMVQVGSQKYTRMFNFFRSYF
jgi:hypothetical protein